MAAGAGLVGADLEAGVGGAVEVGGLEPGVDVGLGGVGCVGELEGALGAVGAEWAGVEFECGEFGEVECYEELVVGRGVYVA